LDVTLDASAITLGDASDEIITFSWDFGDGRTQKNATSAKISHTYTYDTKKDSGEYSPSVSITTKAGKKETFTTDKLIIVTKQAKKSSISIPSHPSQIASIGDSVSFHVQTDGLVTNIQRKLSPDNEPSCNDRTCETVESIYTKP
jgi:hypothetical protein